MNQGIVILVLIEPRICRYLLILHIILTHYTVYDIIDFSQKDQDWVERTSKGYRVGSDISY